MDFLNRGPETRKNSSAPKMLWIRKNNKTDNIYWRRKRYLVLS